VSSYTPHSLPLTPSYLVVRLTQKLGDSTTNKTSSDEPSIPCGSLSLHIRTASTAATFKIGSRHICLNFHITNKLPVFFKVGLWVTVVVRRTCSDSRRLAILWRFINCRIITITITITIIIIIITLITTLFISHGRDGSRQKFIQGGGENAGRIAHILQYGSFLNHEITSENFGVWPIFECCVPAPCRIVPSNKLNPLQWRGNYSATSNDMKLLHWPLMAGCYVWYSEERTRRGRSPPRPLLSVPNVTAHPSTASVPITVLMYNGPFMLCGFNAPVKG